MTAFEGRPGRRSGRPKGIGLSLALLAAVPPSHATAQLSTPCEATCAVVLGATGFTAATGALVAYGRHTGGVSTLSEGLTVWGTGLAVVLGGGLALSGNGARQERAVYAAGIGALAGGLVGLGVESALEESDGARKVAAALIGAAAGALAGGVYGALSQQEGEGGVQASLLSVRITF